MYFCLNIYLFISILNLWEEEEKLGSKLQVKLIHALVCLMKNTNIRNIDIFIGK